jgi:precorrin-6Y C5,15-methyltransferase (decarboxylating)
MSHRVVVIGMGADGTEGLGPQARDALRNATFLAGGTRHLAFVGENVGETFTITNNVPALVERLRKRDSDDRCVVLASGDPLFYGVGQALAEGLGRDQLEILPALSSMQLAFARVGVPWTAAAIASIHGRPLKATLLPLLGEPLLGLFTHNGDSPSEVAKFFAECELPDYDAWVCEQLGTRRERIIGLPLHSLVGRRFDDLNVLILRRHACGARAASAGASYSGPPGIPDAHFARPVSGPVLLTHSDVRAVALARFRDLPSGPIWDIGAGLGGVSVELARAFREREIVAVERCVEEREFLAENRRRFCAYNVRIVAGEAPDALVDEEPPAAVFLGGSGGRLVDILDFVLACMRPEGLLVANFVSLEHLARCLDTVRTAGWIAEVTLVQVSKGAPLADLTALESQRPVWVVKARPRASAQPAQCSEGSQRDG